VQIVQFNPTHLEAITDLYAHFVTTTAITFDLVPPTVDQMAQKLTNLRNSDYPIFVAIDENGAFLGFAYASAYRSKEAYRHTAEVTIYIQPLAQGQGMGSALMDALLKELSQDKSFRLAIAMIADEAQASIKLHKKFGFKDVGYLEEVGHKFDKWHGVHIMQRKLDVLT